MLGSRLLEDQKKVGKTATAIELRQSGENSILGNIAFNVGASLTQIMRRAYWWNSTEAMPDDITNEQVLIELNTDFSRKGLASQDVQVIVAAWQAGDQPRPNDGTVPPRRILAGRSFDGGGTGVDRERRAAYDGKTAGVICRWSDALTTRAPAKRSRQLDIASPQPHFNGTHTTSRAIEPRTKRPKF